MFSTSTKFAVASVLAACLLPAPGLAQTASQLLEKGIYAQETSGDLDAAIQIYRQITGSAFGQRDIAAQAQYRLAEALIKKGDLSAAATEFQKLARDYSDHQALISKLSVRFPEPKKPQPSLYPVAPDTGRPFSGSGEVAQVQWVNPVTYILLKDGASQWAVATASPNALVQGGLTRNSIKTGDRISVIGFWAKEDQRLSDGTPVVSATTVVREDGQKVFDRAFVPAVAREALMMEMAKTLETLRRVQDAETPARKAQIVELEKKLNAIKAQVHDVTAKQ